MKKDRIINEKLNKLSMDMDEVKFCMNDLHHSMQCLYEQSVEVQKLAHELEKQVEEMNRSPIEKAVMNMSKAEVR